MSFLGMLGVAVVSAVTVAAVRQFSRESAVYASAAAAMLLMYYALNMFRPVLSYLYDIGNYGSVGSYVVTITKLTAIGALTSAVSDMCADMGENAVAQKAELVGKGAAAMTVFPILKELISSLGDLLM